MSTRREPSWVDYGNLGANLLEVGLLVAANQKVSQMARVQAAQAERERLENELRQLVFDLEEGLGILAGYRKKAPLGVAVTAVLVDRLLDEVGVYPSTFQQFADKDRVKFLRARLASTMKESLASLGVAEKNSVKKMVPLAAHRDELATLIVALEAKEELTKSEEKWKKLEQEKSAKTTSWKFLALGGLFLAPLFCMLNSIDSDQNERAVLIILALLAFGTLIYSLTKISSGTPKGYRELEQRRAGWRGKLMPHEKYLQACRIFGENLPIWKYKKMDKSIAAFMSRALEHDKDGKPLSNSLVSLSFPERLLKPRKP